MRQAYRSANGPKVELPVARHVAAVGHATPFSAACLAPFGFGLLTSVQPLPFHCWIMVCDDDTSWPVDPTATQLLALGHAMALSGDSLLPAGVAAGAMRDQWLLSHR